VAQRNWGWPYSFKRPNDCLQGTTPPATESVPLEYERPPVTPGKPEIAHCMLREDLMTLFPSSPQMRIPSILSDSDWAHAFVHMSFVCDFASVSLSCKIDSIFLPCPSSRDIQGQNFMVETVLSIGIINKSIGMRTLANFDVYKCFILVMRCQSNRQCGAWIIVTTNTFDNELKKWKDRRR
jgi:hypothetical protein